MKIAVTGANGHVGVNLCKTLTSKGHTVRALTHTHSEFLKDLRVEKVGGDVLNRDSLKPFLEGIDVVFHLAARISITGDPDGSVWKVNSAGTRNMVEIAQEAGIRKFIHFSSIHAFRQFPASEWLDETRPLVEADGFIYDRSKAEGERIVANAACNGLDAVIVSPTAILGPDDPQPSLTGKAVLALYHRQVPALVPGGYNFVDVRDVVDGAVTASERGLKGSKYLLSGTWTSLPDLSALIARLTGARTPRTVVPFWLARVGLPFITGYSRITGSQPLYTSESLQILMEGSQRISHDKASLEIGYHPRGLEVTLADLVRYFKQQGLIKNRS